MVKSKFPGKPSKITSRKVVNSSKYSVHQDNESTKAAENISYGLAVFNEAFGDHDQALTAFHGFSPHDVEKAKAAAKKQQEKVDAEYEANGMMQLPENALSIKLDPPSLETVALFEAFVDSLKPGYHVTRAQCQRLNAEHVPSEFSKPLSSFFSPFKGSVRKHVASRLLQRAKRSTSDSSSKTRVVLNLTNMDKTVSATSAGAMRKFVLPSRSAHSSRVIKPNKRFLDSDENCKEASCVLQPNFAALPTRSRTIELKKPRLILDDRDFSDGKSDSAVIKGQKSDGFGAFNQGAPLSQYISDGSETKEQWKHVKLGDLNVFGALTTRPKLRVPRSSSCGSLNEEDSVVFPPNSGMSAVVKRLPGNSGISSSTSSRIILREAKLNFNASVDILQEGLFSKKPKKSMGFCSKSLKNSGTSMECGVCGAVRFYRFVKQPQKFGINSCEPCRKFIAKMMIKARSSENSVECDKGQGKCVIPPVTRELAKGNRCWACWLLVCLQRYVKMPEKTRDSLVKMLPLYMHTAASTQKSSVETNVILNERLRSSGDLRHQAPGKSSVRSESPLGKRIPQPASGRVRRKAALVSLANTVWKVREETGAQTPLKKKAVEDGPERASKTKKAKHDKVTVGQLKTVERGKRTASKTLEKGKDGLLRQKLSLKGPRVKHVCRSASIVLGQPLATFPNKSVMTPSSSISGPVSLVSKVNPLKGVSDHEHASLPCEVSMSRSKLNSEAPAASAVLQTVVKKTETCSPSSASLLVTAPEAAPVAVSVSSVVPKSVSQLPVTTTSSGRKITKLPSSNSAQFQRGQRRTLQALGVFNTQLDVQPNLVSLDFWESYDPDEVCLTGFGLIGFDPFHVKPICFLCGSAGRKKLIHCASCCEPYHQFCVEMGILGGPLPPALRVGNDEWRVDWVCPRCTVCHGCGRSTGEQLTSCQRCYHSYHIDCLGTTALRKSAGNHPWICSSCLHCKSCNSPDVLKFVGNLPFCKPCFKLRQKGNFCPLCQGCYADDDFQSKMMECAECKSWVHAKCEGLSDEKYQVLSYLPESVEFVCRLCCTLPPAPWWLAVESELQAGYVNIIKAITKNRKACAMLKWSPKKSCSCRQSIHNAAALLGRRRLSFNNKLLCIEANKAKSSVFEFDDDTDAGENTPILKYVHSKEKGKGECAGIGLDDLKVECGIENQDIQEKVAHFSPHAGSQSDSGIGSTDDELKVSSAAEDEESEETQLSLELPADECCCTPRELRNNSLSLMSVKKKVHMSEYTSILEFHGDMDQLISEADSDEVKELYHQTLQEVFPWFDPKYTRVNRSRKDHLPLSPCKPHHGSILQHVPDSPDKQSSQIPLENALKNLIPVDLEGMGDSYYYSGMSSVDPRMCALCKLIGDGAASEEGRLLYCGHNEWVHVNCALWSAEVFEEIDGALQNVTNALSRGRMIRCPLCGKRGASVGCCWKKCEETLHFPCARKAGFVFMEDKNVYCSLHGNDAPGKPLTKDADFDVCRPVYVELDRRKKKSVESQHVRLMIGSLMVENLGKIVAEVSDQGSVIIPTEFLCTRLFWSSKEPWRIVRYTIRTTIRLPAPEPSEDMGLHITVDHSKEEASSSMHLEVVSPSKVTSKIKCGDKEVDEEKSKESVCSSPSCDASMVRAVLNQVLDAVCHKEVEEEVSDPQNPADLLPPELKDAIFEDLPHDLLDGISMQDIFQDKFLNFEDIIKDDAPEPSAEGSNEPNPAVIKNHDQKQESGGDKSMGFKTVKANRELKRSKSDVLPNHTSQMASRLHQRSCSLAWSCKLGASLSHCKGPRLSSLEGGNDRTQLIQELRLSVKPASSVELKYHLQGAGDKGKENQSLTWQRIMQVDGYFDNMSCSSESGSDGEISDDNSVSSTFPPHFPSKVKSLTTSDFAVNHCEKVLGSNDDYQKFYSCSDHQVRKLRRSSKRSCGFPKGKLTETDYTTRIPQLDGAADLSSDSEHDTVSSTLFNSQGDEKPVRCSRCHCTYRTEESYTRHLPNCSGDYSLTTSESEAEMSEDEASSTKTLLPGMDHNSAPSPDSAISVSSGSVSGASSVSPTMPVIPNSTSSMSSVTTDTSSVKTQLKTETHSTSSGVGSCVPQVQIIGSLPSDNCVAPTKVPKVTVNKPKSCKVPARQTSKVLKGNKPIIQHQQNRHHLLQHHNHQGHILQQTVQQAMQQRPQQSQQLITMLDYQQPQQSGPTVLVQSVPSAGMVPAYLEAFQQNTGQNLQYLATVDANNSFGKTQYLAAVPSTVVPGAYQLQAMPDGQLCLDPSSMGLSTIPGLQLAQPQPQMLGALIQSPLQCGVVATSEPVYETLQMYPDQSGGVLLASQPMLTCMETVVSNTYMQMSSSQFVSSTVPGMMQGSSSFSRTTTQVFQASKVDPPVMDVPAQYVVVNPHTTLHEQNVREVVTMAQSQTQESMPVQSQASVHISSINLPVPVTTLPTPIPPQTLPPVIPTSVVAPMPRNQPQRTYSKTHKSGKDLPPIIVKSTLAADFLSAQTKHDISVQTSAIEKPNAKSTSGSQSSVTAAFVLKQNPQPKAATVSTTELKQPFCPASNTPSVDHSIKQNAVLSQPELQVNTAPVQSVTLPDPIKSSHPSEEALSIVDSQKTVSAVISGKVPPVTFSYRSHLTKNQLKTNVTQPPNGWAASIPAPVSVPVKPTTIQPVLLNYLPDILKPASSIQDVSTTAAHPSKVGTIVSSVKPVAAVVPSSQTPLISMSACVPANTSTLTNSSVCATATTAVSSGSIASLSKSSLNVVDSSINRTSLHGRAHCISSPSTRVSALPSTPVSVFTQVTSASSTGLSNTSPITIPVLSQLAKICKEVRACPSQTESFPSSVVMPEASSKEEFTIGKDVSQASVKSVAITSATTTATTSTIKPVNSAMCGMKPLQEINQFNVADSKTCVVKSQLSDQTSFVPPTVLKSSTQNVDASRRQCDAPVLLSTVDKTPSSLKLLFQKQAHNGCYKVSSTPGKQDEGYMAVKLADISIIHSCLKEKKGSKDLQGMPDGSENVKPVDKSSKKAHQNTPQIMYEIHCQDGFTYTSTSISEAWQKVFGAVQEARANHKMPPLLHNPFSSPETAPNVLGMSNNNIKYLLEQLPGVGSCSKYRPIYHKSRLPGPEDFNKDDCETLPKENRSGCARTDPYLSAKKYDMFSWLDSRHRCPPKLLETNDADSLCSSRRATSVNLPMAMRYRHLRETSKTSVGVFRSDIHGRGLFCLRDIEAGEMVIEYAGEVIRNTLTDNRERYYQSKGIGCYMFKVDDNFTVDATRRGNAARFINHSCEPNCYSRVVDILGRKHIIIFAFRRIPQGEELTYDYKFPIEDEKIHCHCLARRCRKYLN